MIENLTAFTEFLVKHHITANQFLLLSLLQEDRFREIYNITENGVSWTQAEMQDLIDRDFMININTKPDEFYADSFVVTDKFTKGLYCDDDSMAKEFLSVYPDYLWIEGKKFPAKNMEPSEFEKLYAKKTHGKLPVHAEIMKCLRYARKNNQITMGLLKWVTTEQWNVIKTEMKNQPDDRNNPYLNRY